jgi:transposase
MRPDAATADVELPDDPDTLKAMIRELLALLKDRDRELGGVRHRLDQLLRRLYGPKSERARPDQPTLFDDPAEPDSAGPPADPEPAPSDEPRRSGRHGRRRLPADLERRRVVHDLSDDEKVCPCCHEPRVVIGEQVSEQLDYHPAKLFVWRHVRLSYACPACLAKAIDPMSPTPEGKPEPPALIVTAPKPPQPIDKGLPGPGLLAHVVTCKYADHLPLHRQEAMLARQGVELSRSTLCDWMAAAADVLTPLYAWMLGEVLRSRVIQTDETRVPVQEPGRAKTKSGRLWVYVGDREYPHTVYDYTATKARDGPAAVLTDFTGFLQADAANVFDGIYAPGSITEVACWAHARRHFHEARDSDAARSAEALARIGAFYGVEEDAADAIAQAKLTGDAADAVRLRLRREQTLPKLTDFAAWLEAQAPVVLPKSPMGQAIAYAQRHWTALLRFTEHGFLNIDNNASERALRAVAIGRKNWLFAGSDAGGRTAAVLYSMTQTCKQHRVDPFAYLKDVLARLPSLPAERLPELAPHAWAEAQRAQLNPTA